jgi:hypothetical protein
MVIADEVDAQLKETVRSFMEGKSGTSPDISQINRKKPLFVA